MIDKQKIDEFLNKEFPTLEVMRFELNCFSNEEKQYIYDLKFRDKIHKHKIAKRIFDKAFGMKLK